MKSKDYIDNFYKDFEGLEINGSSDCESFFDKIQESLTQCQ